MKSALARSSLVAGLFVAASTYFALSCRLTLEWFDEGHLVYLSWRVSEGAVPYREFLHVYGPSVFLLNGALFRLLGDDLAVIRFSLVLLKASAAVLVFLLARCTAKVPFAFVAYLSCVVVWGGPWWAFNSPYASHYALTVCLAGLLLYVRYGGSRGAALAGVCFGVATTFKQTAGAFALVSLVAFLSWQASVWGTGGSAAAVPRCAAAPRRRLAQALRIVALLFSLGLCLVYLAPRNTAWNLFVLLSPLAVAIVWIGVLDLRHGARTQLPGTGELIAAAAGASLPVAGYVVWYASQGLLDDLAYNVVAGLPQKVDWFIPAAVPGLRTVLLTICLVGIPVGLRWRTGGSNGPTKFAGSVAVAAASLAGLLAFVGEGTPNYIRSGAWIGDVYRVLLILPFLLVWASLAAIPGAVPAEGEPPGPEWQRQRAAVLLHIFAASALLFLYPAADFWHGVMALPAFLPSLAFQLERLCADPRTGGVGRGFQGLSAQGIAVSVGLLLCAAPFVQAVVVDRAKQPVGQETFARASGISDGSAKFSDALALVRYLNDNGREGALLTLGEGQMLYFLAGRRSLLEHREFVLYLVATGFIAAEDARSLLPESEIIHRLEESRPLIVVLEGGRNSDGWRRVFAETAAFIDARYRPSQRFGDYRVLEWGTT